MDTNEQTDTVEGEALPLAEGDDGDRAFEDEANRGARADEEAAHEDLYEEIERNGKMATIPAWLKPELLMQADYTRKTQELAEARRAFEAERDTVNKVSQDEISAFANLQVLDRQLDQFSKMDWNAAQDGDAAAAQKAFMQFHLLKDARRERATASAAIARNT